ncbi:hypothetical protein EJ05DRAFT_186351 [Pseudovirgaria hyperparasitica]|uniref:Uncharacterized protein n=1 Tax=Pseudovirgaria hyperparasitica TaxID=470096 RepID=A0A6A6WGA7_9PEZI|nr:uncharacterized protein EJ05DRAFT_186351 [Pseudovirgaria hyperparasitica]KAF2761838.1 hypothetical protein EJ05DRAFT_186351 [Pseudovirgaria hyperparasitica]
MRCHPPEAGAERPPSKPCQRSIRKIKSQDAPGIFMSAAGQASIVQVHPSAAALSAVQDRQLTFGDSVLIVPQVLSDSSHYLHVLFLAVICIACAALFACSRGRGFAGSLLLARCSRCFAGI